MLNRHLRGWGDEDDEEETAKERMHWSIRHEHSMSLMAQWDPWPRLANRQRADTEGLAKAAWRSPPTVVKALSQTLALPQACFLVCQNFRYVKGVCKHDAKSSPWTMTKQPARLKSGVFVKHRGSKSASLLKLTFDLTSPRVVVDPGLVLAKVYEAPLLSAQSPSPLQCDFHRAAWHESPLSISSSLCFLPSSVRWQGTVTFCCTCLPLGPAPSGLWVSPEQGSGFTAFVSQLLSLMMRRTEKERKDNLFQAVKAAPLTPGRRQPC